MTPETVTSIGQQALWVTMMIAAPLLLSALAVGVLVGMFQAATQINEMTMSFSSWITITWLESMHITIVMGIPIRQLQETDICLPAMEIPRLTPSGLKKCVINSIKNRCVKIFAARNSFRKKVTLSTVPAVAERCPMPAVKGKRSASTVKINLSR